MASTSSFKRFVSKPMVIVGALLGSACASSPQYGPSVTNDPSIVESSSAPSELLACPSSPNCVSSVANDAKKQVAAFELNGDSASVYQEKLVSIIEADGGVVKDTREGYVWATYTSKLFRFVDDVEWLYSTENNVFDVRSASRTGHSDLGVNLKRVERLQNAIAP